MWQFSSIRLTNIIRQYNNNYLLVDEWKMEPNLNDKL